MVYKVEVSGFGKYELISFENTNQIDLYSIQNISQIFQEGNEAGVLDWIVDLSSITWRSGQSGYVFS